MCAACEDQWLFCCAQFIGQEVQISVAECAVAGRKWLAEIAGKFLVQYVFRQADDDGARTALGGQVEGFGDHAAGTGGVVKHIDAFSLGAEPRFDVEFLERLAVPVAGGDQADEQHQGSSILPGGVDADECISSGRTAGNHGDTRPAGGFAVGFGHVAGTAFLAAHDGVDG